MPNLREMLYARLLNRSFRRLVRNGIRPTYQKAIDTLRGILGRDKEGATLDPVLVKDHHTFPIDGFNKNLEDIEFDLTGLFEAVPFLAQRQLETALVIREGSDEIRRQVAKISERAERELLTVGSNFLDAVSIRFVDFEHIDQTETTAFINLEAGYAALPVAGGVDRILPATLPDGPTEIETINDDAAYLPGSDFGSIFTDTTTGWQVRTAGNRLRFRFRTGRTIRLNRFVIETPDEGAEVDVRFSRDGMNFIRMAPRQTVRHGRMDISFEETEAIQIEIEITKPVPEDEVGNIFTIQSVAMYKNGYQSRGVLTTRPISIETGAPIKLMSVEIDAETPDNTWVDVEVAPMSPSGLQGDWRRVEGNIIDFTQSSSSQTIFDANPSVLFSSSPVLGTPTARGETAAASYRSELGMNDVWGVEAATSFPSGVPNNIDIRSLRLHRIDNWKVDTQPVNRSIDVVNRMAMESGEKRRMYIQIIDEIHDIEADTNTLNLDRDVISGTHITLVDMEDAQVVRAHGTLDPSLNPAAEFTATVSVLGDGEDKEVIVSGTLPAFAEHFDRLFIPGVGETAIREVDITANEIRVDNTLDYDDVLGSTVQARFQSRSLTRFIQFVQDRTINFTEDLLEGERVVITYNSPMIRTQEDVIQTGVRVVSSIDPVQVGVIGLDYRIRDNEIELLPTTRLPAQSNTDVHPVIVEFSYSRLTAGPTTYTAWCHVPDGANREISIAQPVRPFGDEKITWMDPKGRVVDMNGLERMTLASGWHRFSVVGKRAITEHNEIDQASALFQLLNLESAGGSYIFRFPNGYFDGITGFREPLVPAGRFFMEHQARPNDTERFAYEDGDIITAFRMDNPKDAIRLTPGSTTVDPAVRYSLRYTYAHTQGIEGVKVRTILNRDAGALPSLTPKVKGISLRFT